MLNSQIFRRGLWSIALVAALGQPAKSEPITSTSLIPFVSCAADVTVMGQTYLSLGSPDYKPIFDDARKCLDSNLETAISLAGYNAELKSAVKDYYIKAVTLCGSNSMRAYRQGEQPFDEARTRIILEARLAKLWTQE